MFVLPPKAAQNLENHTYCKNLLKTLVQCINNFELSRTLILCYRYRMINFAVPVTTRVELVNYLKLKETNSKDTLLHMEPWNIISQKTE